MIRSASRTRGFTLVELLVVIAILAMLVAILLPAVQYAREAARITQCKNNIRQLALGTLLHQDALTAFPPARLMPRPGDQEICGLGTPTWMVRILPFIEERDLFSEWELSQPFAAHPVSTRTRTVSSFYCPSRRDSGNSILQADVTREFNVGPSPIMWCPG